jgi:toxin FitB
VILLDTNVISALMRHQPDHAVIDWLNRQTLTALWTTAISIFEIEHGIRRLATGRRQQHLQVAFQSLLRDDLDQRIATFDAAAAKCAAELAAQREKRGRPVDLRDTQIAGIAMANNASLVTRNSQHFGDLAIPVFNPWSDPGPIPDTEK